MTRSAEIAPDRSANVQLYKTEERPTITIAIDSSAVLAVLLGEGSRAALIRATEGAALVGAPCLPWEVGNALVAAARRHRLKPSDVRVAWTSYTKIPVRFADIDVARALDLAASHRLPAYGAYAIETARTEGAPLLALDAEVADAARAIGVALLELAR